MAKVTTFAILLVFLSLRTATSASGLCNLGFYVGSSGKCEACPANCLICQPNNGSLPCYSCNVTYTVNIKTLTCEKCMDNCLKCLNG